MQVVFRCFSNSLTSSEIAQFITLATHLQDAYGVSLFRQIFEAVVPEAKIRIQYYLTIFQLLIDLQDMPKAAMAVKTHLPDLQRLCSELQLIHNEYLAAKYPKRNIDQVIERFATKDEITQFPLAKEKLLRYKTDYIAIEARGKEISALPQENLKTLFLKHAKLLRETDAATHKHLMIAIMCEVIRRIYKIVPYDTQIIALLAILDAPPADKKGYLAQIKTGEGKSTVEAMAAAFIAGQKYFYDAITSSSYLAKRDCDKYQPFFKDLGLSASHISDDTQKQSDFHAQILYGTNTAFEFALLRDGLNKTKLRYSYPLGESQLQPRTFDVVFIDEVDNMMLDNLGAARMSIPGHDEIAWIYHPILEFVKNKLKQSRVNIMEAFKLQKYLQNFLSFKEKSELSKLPLEMLIRWLKSAQTALYVKKEKKDYLVGTDIRIVDYTNTGRINEGCQWQHGIHQFLQAKHQLKITPQSLTGASISHPTYFGLYKKIYGLTGTMGEEVERKEIEEIYQVASFDVPPHYPSKRTMLPPIFTANIVEQRKELVRLTKEIQLTNRPQLDLFESIEESDEFSSALHSAGFQHQVLNETQRESEDYIVGRAGEARMITDATNTAGRGTDIILDRESLDAGGLLVNFSFYPGNSRVEGQGFGRGGRQGQLGSGRYILRLDDPRIVSLLASCTNTELLKQWVDAKTDEQKLQCLNRIRTENIKEISKERRHNAQLESLYFTYLNKFFNFLQAFYQELDTPATKAKLAAACHLDAKPAIPLLMINENMPAWSTILRIAKELTQQQKLGKTVDWSAFIEQFKEAYIASQLDRWSVFYSKLSDQIQGMDIAKASSYVQQEFLILNIPQDLTTAMMMQTLNCLLYKVAAPEVATTQAQLAQHTLFAANQAEPNQQGNVGVIKDLKASP